MTPRPCEICDAAVLSAHTMAGVPLAVDAKPVEGGLFELSTSPSSPEPCASARGTGAKGLGYRVHVCEGVTVTNRRIGSFYV